MIISCPKCDTSYNIPDETLKPNGRKVRCSTCSHRWQVTPPADEDDSASAWADEAVDQTTEPAFDQGDVGEQPPNRQEPKFYPSNKAQQQARSRTSPKAVLGWLSLLVLVAGLATFVLARERLAMIVPALEPVYAMIGLSTEQISSLRLRDVISNEILQDGQAVILIKGMVLNDGDELETVPALQVSLLDDARNKLESGIFGVEQESLNAGEMTAFEARFFNPPDEAKQFSVAFDQPTPNE